MSDHHATQAESQVPVSESAVPFRSRYLTRSATRRGTANISHILQRAPATTRPSRTTKASTSVSGTSTAPLKTRTPFIEALNRVAASDDIANAEASSSKQKITPEHRTPSALASRHDGVTQISSPAKPLPLNRKRPSNGMLSSPRGIENSPNSRPRKVARMPRVIGVGPSPLKSLVRHQQPTIRSDALSVPQITTGEASTVPVIPCAQTATKTRDDSVSGSTVDIKPKLFSPAKVPVGSQTPFRYGTNRILDVPLSAVKKGGRWSLASDLSDDSLLLAASPRKPVDRPNSTLSSMSLNPTGKKAEGDRHALKETAKDLELLFLEENAPDDIPPDARKTLQTKMHLSTGTLAKYTVEKSLKAVPQKTSAARIIHRAQKSLSLPRTTSSYANPTRSSMNAAAITAASIDARTSLKNAIKEPTRKPLSTPATQITAPAPAVFARPCKIQSRTSTIALSTLQPNPPKPCSATASLPSQQSPGKSPEKTRSYIPVSPIRERNANIPHEGLKPTIQSDAIGSGRPIPIVNNARRKSLTMETSKSLYGLSAALAKLTVKRPSLEGRPPDAEPSKATSQQTKSNDAPQHARHQPTKPVAISRIPQSTSMHGRSSLGGLGRGALDVKAGSLGESVVSSLKITRPMHSGPSVTTLKGVIAFIDVRTAEGDDTSAVFAEMLRSCGARVLTKPTESCTHIIFKSGKISTLIWWRKQPEPKPHMVGIGWVTKCRDSGERVPETGFEVDVAAQAVFQKAQVYGTQAIACTYGYFARVYRIDNRVFGSSQSGNCAPNVDALWTKLALSLLHELVP